MIYGVMLADGPLTDLGSVWQTEDAAEAERMCQAVGGLYVVSGGGDGSCPPDVERAVLAHLERALTAEAEPIEHITITVGFRSDVQIGTADAPASRNGGKSGA
jgi:hypothetical protein